MLRPRSMLAIGSAVALCGCVAPPPSGPQVLALPSANKNFAQFQQEDATCRQNASQAIGIATAPPAVQSGQPATQPSAPPPTVPLAVAAEMQERYDVTYTQCMYASGNQVTAPPAPVVYAGSPYYGVYSPYYYGPAFGGPYYEFGIGFGGGRGYYGGGYRGGYREGGGYRR